jgi:LPS O-antigen subunit length determinant protein (WzzB/FepE family)
MDDLRINLLFRQEIEKNRSALANNRREAEILETTILEMRPEIRQLRARLRTENAARLELESKVNNFQTAYDEARTELDRLVNLEHRLPTYSRLSAVQDPTQPVSPVSPRRSRNIALAMFLGLVIGVGSALLVDYYQGRPANSATPVRG